MAPFIEPAAPQPGSLTPDQSLALAEMWSYLLHLWYSESPASPGQSSSFLAANLRSLRIKRSRGALGRWGKSDQEANTKAADGTCDTSEGTIENKPSTTLSPLNSCYHHLHRLYSPIPTSTATALSHSSLSDDAPNQLGNYFTTKIAMLQHRCTSTKSIKPWPASAKFKFKYTPVVYHDAFWNWVQNEHPDSIVIRCLKACKWKPKNAMERLMLALEWRITYGLDELSILEEEALDRKHPGFLYLLQRGRVAIPGYDRQGRPLMYGNPSVDGHKYHDAFRMGTFYGAEHVRLLLMPPNDSFSGIVDLSTLCVSDVELAHPSYIMHAVYNFCKMMGIGTVYNPPWYFYPAWKIASPLLDEDMREQLGIISSRNEVEKLYGPDILAYMRSSDDDKEEKQEGKEQLHHGPVDNGHTEASSSSPFAFPYLPPVQGENDLFHMDSESKQTAIMNRKELELEFERATIEWLEQPALPSARDMIMERDVIGYKAIDAFWAAEPYTRIRSVFHRLGKIRVPEPFFSQDGGCVVDCTSDLGSLSSSVTSASAKV